MFIGASVCVLPLLLADLLSSLQLVAPYWPACWDGGGLCSHDTMARFAEEIVGVQICAETCC